MDCVDGSDENNCSPAVLYPLPFYGKQPPVIVSMDGQGSVSLTSMTANDLCPGTHFRCPQPVYCMPVFLRCNGVKDCPYGEDELSCQSVLCPGYYRCRASSVCLHPSHVCDGVPQCPQRDDELLCNASCPSVCQCQGLVYVCHKTFPASSYPSLKYLDAEGSGMTPAHVSDNFYLIYLSLAVCHIDLWDEVNLKNLQRLHLNGNQITVIYVKSLLPLIHLRFLSLKGNPLEKFVQAAMRVHHQSLLSLDLSYTNLQQLDEEMFANLPSLEVLNLSFSSLTSINKGIFVHVPNLRYIDLERCEIKLFSESMYAELENLESIKAANYKLCCNELLPKTFNEKHCWAPQDEMSSCADLLKSNFHRIFLWLIVTFSVVGNASSSILRRIGQYGMHKRSGCSVFVTSLRLSDILKGVYVGIIAVADQLYKGQYLWNESKWKSNIMCKVAGYLSFLSTEETIFMIVFITLDHFTMLCSPLCMFRFKRLSAIIATGLAWLSALFLAAVPLLTVFSHWHFYEHTGICTPLPLTMNSLMFKGQDYLYNVMIIFNFSLIAFVVIAQISVRLSKKVKSMEAAYSTNTSQNVVEARLISSVVVLDCLCWFPICLMGLVTFNSTPIPEKFNVALAIFVLPLHSAVNPLLYTFNMIEEKQRQAREVRLLKFLQARIRSQQCS